MEMHDAPSRRQPRRCPVCGGPGCHRPAHPHTCSKLCERVWRRRDVICDRGDIDPWYVSYGSGYSRTADPGWGY